MQLTRKNSWLIQPRTHTLEQNWQPYQPMDIVCFKICNNKLLKNIVKNNAKYLTLSRGTNHMNQYHFFSFLHWLKSLVKTWQKLLFPLQIANTASTKVWRWQCKYAIILWLLKDKKQARLKPATIWRGAPQNTILWHLIPYDFWFMIFSEKLYG